MVKVNRNKFNSQPVVAPYRPGLVPAVPRLTPYAASISWH
jgi:hypothetical protein